MSYKKLFQLLVIWIFIGNVPTDGKKLADFICTDGTKIELNKVCNGATECPDGSDETKKLCYHIICPRDMFRCHYGACIHNLKKCDGKTECADGSDESQCGRRAGSCENNEFRCKSGQCILLDKICDGSENCADGSDESQTICEEFSCPSNTFHCKYGGCIHLDACCNGHNDCIDGSDETELLCKNMQCSGAKCNKCRFDPRQKYPERSRVTEVRKQVKCAGLDLSRIEAICESESSVIPCDNPVPLGTKVKYNCKQFYKPANEKHIYNERAQCQLDGRWNKEILKCEPVRKQVKCAGLDLSRIEAICESESSVIPCDNPVPLGTKVKYNCKQVKCGKLNSEALPLVVKGWDTKPDIYPWHAALYNLEDGNWMFWCGGTLISEKTVLTAGHCTWGISPESLKIAAGKYHSDFSKRESFTQIKDVKKIISQPLYQDRVGNYGSDLTILILSDPIQLSAMILPACVDWNLEDIKHHLEENSTGLIVGMGITENETYSDILRGVYIPVVSNDKCMKEEEQDFKKYVTYTVFCAGWRNGTGVCNGDSGGGMMFPKVNDKSRWVVQGVVSISPRRRGTSFCDPFYYTVFTKIGLYLNWIKEILKDVHPNT